MPTLRFTSEDKDLDQLYEELSEHNLQPLWELTGLLTPEPKVKAIPYGWHARDLRPLAERAGRLVGIDRGGDRRVLSCANPGLGGAPYAVGTLWAAVQYLNVGEAAPAHRHTPAALRFVLQGSGVWTTVDGDAIHMTAGDLVLTPSWTFHEHHNSGSAPMMWLDVLDLPVVAALDAVFFEEGHSEDVPVRTPIVSHSEGQFGGGPGLLPVTSRPENPGPSPLLAYRREDTDRALRRQVADGVPVARVRYCDPATGRDVMPTMRCEMVRVPAGNTSPQARQTGSRIACVFDGSGTAEVDGTLFGLAPGDIIAIPSWCDLTMSAADELDVFFTSDAPILEALGLYREDTAQ